MASPRVPRGLLEILGRCDRGCGEALSGAGARLRARDGLIDSDGNKVTQKSVIDMVKAYKKARGK